MKKIGKKSVLISTMTMAMIIPMSASGAFALDANQGEGETIVSYDNTNSIVDPGNPNNPQWSVNIPSTIKFSDENKKVGADVELVKINNGTIPTNGVSVKVASAKGYKLDIKGEDAMKYALEYTKTDGALAQFNSDRNPTAGTKAELDTLTETKPKVVGYAVMRGTATKVGAHTDTLTYTVEVKK